KNIQISNDTNWQDLHWKSIKSAYSSSPFFEFYEHDIQPLFENEATNLMAFNFKCFEVVLECLQEKIPFETTTEFDKNPSYITDLRTLTDNRKEIEQHFKTYTQVFDDKHGFISNLSILDLIFNEGPNAMLYLEAQHLTV